MKTISVVLVMLCACGTTDSSALLTKGMSALMSASTTGNGMTQVSAELFDGFTDQLIFVDLKDGDKLVATGGGRSMTLGKTQLVTIIDYTAIFPTANEGDVFTIDFQRTLDGGAPSSTATLPAPFEIAPLPTTSQSRAAALSVTYSPTGTPGDNMHWAAKGDCISDASAPIGGDPDPGAFTIPANTLVAAPGATSTTCSVTLSVYRERSGDLDAHFAKGGSILGEQARTATFTSAP
jgi:hypothetical protein